MKKTQKRSSAWRRLYMRYRFWLICINYNFDFLVFNKMYFQNYFARRSIILESFTSHLQHSRPCCIRYTNSRLRLEFVYLIQHGRSCCKYYLENLDKSYYNFIGGFGAAYKFYTLNAGRGGAVTGVIFSKQLRSWCGWCSL